jgi:antitoxin MazE
MRARIIKIGNSQGIRIPKPILEQSGITEDVDIEVENNQIIIRPLLKHRTGWDKAFRKMTQYQDDKLIDGDKPISHPWDETEWQW